MRRKKTRGSEIDPDEIFLDSVNLPQFDNQQFEGRIEQPISKNSLYVLGTVFVLVFGLFAWKAEALQIEKGSVYADRSTSNTLRQIPVYGDRGLILDRNGVTIASNDPTRTYPAGDGLAHILGYVGFPSQADLAASPYLSSDEYIGRAGAEKTLTTHCVVSPAKRLSRWMQKARWFLKISTSRHFQVHRFRFRSIRRCRTRCTTLSKVSPPIAAFRVEQGS